MTNKVKPVFIRITDDMTPQMVQDAFDKCVDAGANAEECIAETNRKHSYQDEYDTNFNYFGVDDDNITVLYDNHENYGIDAQEITLDQLDEWLGLEVEQEWKNGDECRYDDINWLFCGFHPVNGLAIVANNDNPHSHQIITVDVNLLSKPETPEQKAEREKKEEAKEMIQCLLDNYTECDDSAVEYVIDYLKECNSLGK